ncbi:ATPase [Sulfodiicoccus acidiphilus]|uniref:ATPase n=1 Tax=Sulfodiicoccus acidiphilus TaxID=1670455 RepID=A0A348B440_9CREN|nr:BadF/BadG/BcrA/BcrD ATPase family protein [Sulfodiicoccus acidiphilus]BBD72942.1 ATPase [Sulfodiicoccus acidiphilus]GGT87833.1 ATPase [Sulfodiicoccus acidiphilus]
MILVGVDAGGTHTRALAYTCDGEELGRGRAGPGNFHNVGLEVAMENVRKAVAQTGVNQPDYVCLGMAGLDTKRDVELVKPLADRLGRHVRVEHDGFVTLYAQTWGKPGVITIAGTGSAVVGYDGTRKRRAANMGWLLGDEGSAYWIGREALRALTRTMQGVSKRSQMTTMVKEKIGVKTLDDLVEWAYYNGHRVSEIAGVAEVVEKAAKVGDKLALKIMRTAARELAAQSVNVAKKVGVEKVYVIGGVFESQLYFKLFSDWTSKRGVKTERAEREGVLGAVLIASQEAGCLKPLERHLHS